MVGVITMGADPTGGNEGWVRESHVLTGDWGRASKLRNLRNPIEPAVEAI